MKVLVFAVVFVAVQAAAMLASCIGELTASLGGDNVVTSAASIPPAYNQVFSSYVPAAMVTPRSGAEVAQILNTADKYGVTVAVRSFAGHSYIGQSTMGSAGIVMNLKKLDLVEIAPEGSTGGFLARIGAGLPLIEVYSRLAMHSPPLGLSGGTCPSVGLSGLVSGGGEGMTSTFGGITSDRLVAAKAVVWNATTSTRKWRLRRSFCLRSAGEWAATTAS